MPKVLEWLETLRSVLSRAIDLLRDLRTDIVSASDPRLGQVESLLDDLEDLLT